MEREFSLYLRLTNYHIQMNRILKLLGAALVCAAGGASAAAEEALIVHFTDGTVTSFVVSKKPRVAFGEKTFNIVAEELSAEYPVESVHKFSLGEHVGLSDVAQRECRFTWSDRDHVTAVGLAPGEQVTLTAIDGKIASTYIADGEGSLTIDLTNQGKGIYVVSSPSIRNFKILH